MAEEQNGSDGIFGEDTAVERRDKKSDNRPEPVG